MPTIHQRIKRRREELKMSRAELGKLCKVTQQAVYGWEETEAMPSYNRLRFIAEALKTTPEYLSTGIDVNVPLASKYCLVRLLGTDILGGAAVDYHNEVGDLIDDEYTFAYRREFLQRLGVTPQECRVYMRSAGDDSMDLGEQLLVDVAHKDLADGKVFLLDTPAGLQVRRLFLQIDGQVRVCADGRNVPEQLAPASAIKVIGRVVAHQGAV